MQLYGIIIHKKKTHGFTPYELSFEHTSGRHPRFVEVYLDTRLQHNNKVLRNKTINQKEKPKLRFDKNISKAKYKCCIDDLVYIKK